MSTAGHPADELAKASAALERSLNKRADDAKLHYQAGVLLIALHG